MRVGVVIYGRKSVHAPHHNGNYDTLCGIDASDPSIGHEGLFEPGPSRIDCPDCKSIWTTAKLLTARDFDPALNSQGDA